MENGRASLTRDAGSSKRPFGRRNSGERPKKCPSAVHGAHYPTIAHCASPTPEQLGSLEPSAPGPGATNDYAGAPVGSIGFSAPKPPRAPVAPRS